MGEILYLVDSNVLLRWIKPGQNDYSAIVSDMDAIIRRNGVLCFTSQNLAEFWNTCTRPVDRNGYGLSPAETHIRANFLEARLRLFPDSLAVHQEWRQLLVSQNISGVQLHDAKLVAAMLVYGTKYILTFNERDFARYPGIEAINSRQGSPMQSR